jgi:hypothetical protein
MGRMTDLSAARISDHARTAMAQRAVTEAQVREVLSAVGQDPPEVVTVYATTQFRRYGAKP